MTVTHISGDDWEAVYLDDKLYYQGHSIPDFVWLQVLELLVNVNEYWSDWPTGRAEPSLQEQRKADVDQL